MHDTQTDRHVLQCSYAWQTHRQTCMCYSVHMHDTQTDRQTDRHVLQCSYAWQTDRQTCMCCSVQWNKLRGNGTDFTCLNECFAFSDLSLSALYKYKWIEPFHFGCIWITKSIFYKKQPSTLLLTYSYICRPLSFWSCGSALCMFIKYRLICKVTASVETIQH